MRLLLSLACITSLLTGCPTENVDDAGADVGAIDAGHDAPALDAFAPMDAPSTDAGTDAGADAPTLDAPVDAPETDAGSDAGVSDTGVDAPSDAGARTNVLPGFCPGTATAPGLYRGNLASSLNDIDGACGESAAGRDGALRVEVAPGETLRARYRHAGDGVLYLLDSCPVVGSCLASSDTSGEETLSWTNPSAASNPVYLILDSTSLAGAQTFELDLFLDAP